MIKEVTELCSQYPLGCYSTRIYISNFISEGDLGSRQPSANCAFSPDNHAKPKVALKCPTYVLVDYLLLYFFRLVRSIDRLAGGRSVLRCRMRLWCVFLSTGGVSWITSPCLLVGLPLHPHKSKGKCDTHVEGLDNSGRALELC